MIKKIKIKNIVLLLSLLMMTGCGFMDCDESDNFTKQEVLDSYNRVKQLATNVYGFLKGDEIIKYTADTIVRCVHNYIHEGAFVGHIGGDDFIAIVPILNCDEICKNIIASFDAHVTKFFTEEDVEKGYIEVANRKGIIEQFPLTSISIGVVEADVGRFANMLEIGEVGAQVKHNAKAVMGSSYFIDRRKK